jgi:hypothetical protein
MKRIKGNNPRGVRLHHPFFRNGTLTIMDESAMYPTPYPCPTCEIPHIFKTHHIQIDEHGNGIVHRDLYEVLKDLGLLRGLKAMKEVTPRGQRIVHGQNFQSDAVLSLETGQPVKLPQMNGHGKA